MRMIIETRTLVVAAAALASVSCAKLGSGSSSPSSPSGADDNGSITSASPATGTKTSAPSTMHVPASPTVVPALSSTSAPAPDIETQSPPPSPAVLQAVDTAQATLDGLTSGIAGTRVRFVDCSEAASCTARLEAQSLAGLRDLLQGVSQQQGGVGFVAREQLDAFTGRTFVADVTLGAAAARAIPTDENALLAN
jgi:hypothetical protein